MKEAEGGGGGYKRGGQLPTRSTQCCWTNSSSQPLSDTALTRLDVDAKGAAREAEMTSKVDLTESIGPFIFPRPTPDHVVHGDGGLALLRPRSQLRLQLDPLPVPRRPLGVLRPGSRLLPSLRKPPTGREVFSPSELPFARCEMRDARAVSSAILRLFVQKTPQKKEE